MIGKLEYDSLVQRLISATVAVFGVLVISVALAPGLAAQAHGVPASVTSFGFGGQSDSTPGVPASITSLGPQGFHANKFFSPPGCCINPLVPSNPNPPLFQRHHHHPFFPLGAAVYAVPYMPVVVEQPEAGNAEEEDYNGGPTIFDRRGSGQSARSDEYRYAERARRDERAREPAAEPTAQNEAPAIADQPATLLVFKDRHQLEIQNYAVVGDTLFDLTPGHRRKIALAELDLTATIKQNEDRGTNFQLPVGPQKN